MKSAKEDIKPGISVITALRDRNDFLEETLPLRMRFREIDEFIIVDWSSKKNISEIISRQNDSRIKYVRVENEPKWMLTPAFNLAASFTEYDKILKADADIIFGDDFFDHYSMKKGRFYAGNYKLARNRNEIHLNGVVLLWREDFFRVNGYNEYIRSYGWDDDDLYNRLENAGLKRLDIDPNHVRHLPHHKRLKYRLESTTEELIDKHSAKLCTTFNRILTEEFPDWKKSGKRADFHIEKHGSTYICTRKSKLPKIPSEKIRYSKIKAVDHFLSKMLYKIPQEYINSLTETEKIEIFDSFFKEELTEDRLRFLKLLNFIREYGADDLKFVNDLYSSYSWRIGHGFVKIAEKIIKPFRKK